MHAVEDDRQRPRAARRHKPGTKTARKNKAPTVAGGQATVPAQLPAWIEWDVDMILRLPDGRFLQHCLGTDRFGRLVTWMNKAGNEVMQAVWAGMPAAQKAKDRSAAMFFADGHGREHAVGAFGVVNDMVCRALNYPGGRLVLRPGQDHVQVMKALSTMERSLDALVPNNLKVDRLKHEINMVHLDACTPFITREDTDRVIRSLGHAQPARSGKPDTLRLVLHAGRAVQILVWGTSIPAEDWTLVPRSKRKPRVCNKCGTGARHGYLPKKNATLLLGDLLDKLEILPEKKSTVKAPQSTWSYDALKRLLVRFEQDYL